MQGRRMEKGLPQNRGSPERCTKTWQERPIWPPGPAPDFHRGSMVSRVGADAHIGPPGSGCKAVRRTHTPSLRRRGGLYIRPEPGASTTGPVYFKSVPDARCAPLRGAFGDGAFDADTERADVGIGPYGVRSSMVHPTHRCARADIKSAPTDPPPGFLVGAACMAARTGSRLPPGFDGFLRRGARSAGGCL